ncbi:glycoside hydrolase family 3 protein [Streptomyces sp. NBC_01808]|uniref:glycoside hydrolase family 3 protein n=1 Tax=Streptomyces sp. NBC_01808 TaxID=2975947 RepID=UPI002DDBEE49|nr:glycoside hydrolase family 3 protein [Streptomyces sp. NBC_01808]WSA39918.1 glycoside hydrolase family 3 protein [Streptomyces sp. NBC_01808]
MTLAEKAGQMIQVQNAFLGDPRDLTRLGIGAMLSAGDDGGPRGGGSDAAAWARMVDGYQRAALRSRLRIPLLYGADAVHGMSGTTGSVIFPHHIGMGATRDPALVRRTERVARDETLGAGVRWAFTPCVCVPQDVRWGRTYEGYAEDPALVGKLGAASVRGFQGAALGPRSVLATAKHFLGDGATAYGTATGEGRLLDQGDVRVTEKELRRVHLAPYRDAIAAGVGSVMASYSSVHGTKTHGDRRLLTGLLKGELGFRGFVVSDYDAVQQLPGKDLAAQVARAVNAGIDMVMVSRDYRGVHRALVGGVRRGDIPRQRVDDAVGRILAAKDRLGLFDRPFTAPARTAAVGSPRHRAVARQAVRASQVLLRNERGALPLPRRGPYRIVVGGNGADDLGRQLGGWSVGWQGGTGRTTRGTTFVQALRAATAGTGIEVATEGRGDVGIWVGGEDPYAEWFGDSETLALGARNEADLADVCGRTKTCVGVLYSGRPLVLGKALARTDAFVAAWLPGTEARGITDALFGAGFSGRLPVTWPRRAADGAVSREAGAKPLFRYGHGLRPY